MRMRRFWRTAISVTAALAMTGLYTSVALASGVDAAVVDATAPTGSVSLAPGDTAAIAINLSVSGKQDGTATFKVYTDWTLSGGAFTGSNPVTRTVAPRPDANAPATTFTVSGTVTVASNEPQGTRTLSAEAFDITNSNGTGAKLGAGGASSYQVTVTAPPSPGDTTAPVLTLPADITAEATGPGGAAVGYSASAADAVDGTVPVDCTPASGSVFPVGPSGVTCTATDSHHNTASGTFTVTVVDTTGPDVTVPADKTAEATGPDGASVSFTATASDLVDGSTSVTCDPASGSTFALGDTTVTCSSTDAHGNPGSATFTVTVVDTTAPVLQLPPNISQTALSAAGSTVSYSASATDLVDGAVTPVCAPASGTLFGLGATTVTCSATDAHQNTATGTFTVTVTVPWNGILQPINTDGSSIFKQGSTVPVKFAGFAGLTATLRVAKVENAIEGTTVEAASTAAADTGNQFRYDATAGQYIFNLNTKVLTAGTYVLHISLGDGVDHTVTISLKK